MRLIATFLGAVLIIVIAPENKGSACSTCATHGPCFEPHPWPSCESHPCCGYVCDIKPECCNNEWDQECADLARFVCTGGPADVVGGDGIVGVPELLYVLENWGDCAAGWTGVCGGSDAGDCGEPNGTPGCSNAACCALVCDQDPFCCDFQWDSICSSLAYDICLLDCGGITCEGDFVGADGNPGTDDFVGVPELLLVLSQWSPDYDSPEFICGNEAAGSCHEPNMTPACDDAGCCEMVCAQDPFCCDGKWDFLCVQQAKDLCVEDKG